MSILKRLDQWAEEKGSSQAFIFLNANGEEAETVTYAALRERALRIAANLKGERAVLFFPPGIDFIAAFLACLYSGTIAIPIPPPQSKRQLARVRPVMQDANPNLILTTQGLGKEFDVPKLIIEECEGSFSPSPIPESQIAFLQYTSGSTSRPKGVILTHGHLFHHQKVIQEAFRHNEETRVVGWLPFYHDMGLIGNILQPLFLGVPCILMAPLTFIQRPFRWLEAVSRYKATTSGGPNFAYQLCCSKISDPDLSKLDLSSWKLAFNGAERVHSSTLNAFAQKFAPCGFSASSFFPCYGMAETTLFVSGRQEARSTQFQTPEGSLSDVVNCGSPCLDEKVAVVDPTTKVPCPDKIYGEIWVSGPSVAKGYWNQPEETEKTFRAFTASGEGPYLRTGDLGFLENGELFVLGRLKNMVILRGKNYFPHDLESAATASHPALAAYQGAAFSIEGDEGEELVLVHEADRHLKSAQEVFQAIKQALSEEFEIAPFAIVLAVPNSLPRTTSGKIQHFAVRQQFLENGLSSLFSWKKEETSSQEEPDTIASKLSQLLGTPVDPQEPMVKYGVDSLTAIQLAGWIQERFGKEIDLPLILNGASAKDLETITSAAAPLSIDPSLTEYPLSPNQENVWVSSQLSSSSKYTISFAFEVEGTLDEEALRSALALLMERHAPLRTHFASRSGKPVQIVSPSVPVPLSIQETLPQEAPVFDLSQAPLFQAVLARSTLFFSFHHLIFDGWSVEIFLKELESAYRSETLPQKPIPYSSFVHWQEEHSRSAETSWEKRLKAEDYPTLKISPFLPSKQEEASPLSFSLDGASLDQFAADQQATAPVILMAAFHALLHLYTGEKRIYVGFPAANRPHLQFQNLIGFFVNTLVSKTEGAASFLDLLAQVKQNVWTDAKETAYPFQELLQLLHPPRLPDSSPLFQAMFVMQNAPTRRTHFAGLPIRRLEVPSSDPLYDLVLEVEKEEYDYKRPCCIIVNHRDRHHRGEGCPRAPLRNIIGGVGLPHLCGTCLCGSQLIMQQPRYKLIFEYKSEKIPASFVRELGATYLSFLNQAFQKPDAPLESLLEDTSLIALFERQALANPDKIAIYSDRGNLTYRELKDAASGIAAALQSIRPSEPIGVCLEREPLLIASLLGILKAGGAYVPIDPAYPPARIEAMVEDAKIRTILASKKGAESLPFFQGTLLDPDIERSRPPSRRIAPPGLAYILYTSGSTGKPKGVMVEQKSLLNFALAATEFFEVNSEDRFLQFSSICWDTSSEEIYPALLKGASIVLRGEGRVESFDTLYERTEKYKITAWDLPSSYWHDLVDLWERKQIAPPPSLRLVIVGGERVNRSKVVAWCNQVAPEVKLLNTYGATEAASISAVYDLSKWPPEWEDIPIGRPIQNVQLHILNSRLKPVPPGMPGDLYISGAGLAKGYLNLPELTAERFLHHPETGERIYKTGDTALKTICGEVLIRGRSDRQIKRRGFRIELEEIEKVLSQFPGAESSLALLKDQLKVYLAFPNQLPAKQAVRDFLRERLPEYMIPDQICYLREIPRLHNGKIDFLSLDASRIDAEEAKAENPSTATEEKIAQVWKELLGFDVGKQESFFDVGGHSLLLIRLHEKLQEAFSLRIDISTLFSHYTIASQARTIDAVLNKGKKLSKLDLLRQLENGSIDPEEAKRLLAMR